MASSDRNLGGRMMQKQRGVTMIGWIFLLVPVALVVYAGIRVGPEYLNYYKVVSALEKTKTNLKNDETLSAVSIRQTIEKEFDVGYIDRPKVSEIGVTKGENGWEMSADYESTVPMFGNLYLLMAFKKTVVFD
jgi:uncharacterized protein DUF4845